MVFYDVIPKMAMGNARSCQSLDELLGQSDFVTLHVPQLASTVDLIGAKEIAMMPKGSFLINLSRGNVVDVDAFANAIKAGHLAGGGADVFPKEPKGNGEGNFESPLCGLKNMILTPHIGGSTEEAQEAIGVEVSNAIIKYINSGVTYGAVNFPELDVAQRPGTHRMLSCHRNVPGIGVRNRRHGTHTRAETRHTHARARAPKRRGTRTPVDALFGSTSPRTRATDA